MKHIAMLLPGIMGSVLKLNDQVIWPGSLKSLVAPFDKMDELLSPDLIATDCIRRYSISDQYQSLIDDLNKFGFDEGKGTLVVFAYDWRKDNAESAILLSKTIALIHERHQTDLEITLLAHSMGGLVARHYLESNLFADQKGFNSVKQVIFLGTPHRGAVAALPVVRGKESRLWLNSSQVHTLSNDYRYPSAYQLLPHTEEPFAWKRDGSVVGLYDRANAEKLGLDSTNLQSALSFHRTLNLTQKPPNVKYFCFVGTGLETATHAFLESSHDNRLNTTNVALKDGGDGTVPTWSASLPNIQQLYIPGEHAKLYKGREFRKMLATCLGIKGVLLGILGKVELFLDENVVLPNNKVTALITFERSLTEFRGYIVVERCNLDESDKILGYDKPVISKEVSYKGMGMESMKISFEAPEFAGFYRISLKDEIGKEPSGFDELIVQRPR